MNNLNSSECYHVSRWIKRNKSRLLGLALDNVASIASDELKRRITRSNITRIASDFSITWMGCSRRGRHKSTSRDCVDCGAEFEPRSWNAARCDECRKTMNEQLSFDGTSVIRKQIQQIQHVLGNLCIGLGEGEIEWIREDRRKDAGDD